MMDDIEKLQERKESITAPAAGELLAGRYRVLSTIGSGGMGVVYRVEQVFAHKELALKTLNLSSMSDANVRRFQQEAKAAFVLDHPGLVKVYDTGVLDDGRPYLVMDLVKGKTLSEVLKEKTRLSLTEAVDIFVQACFGIAHAHQLGIVHRDIKPSNIMLVSGIAPGTEGSVKILDFGIARFLQHEGGEIQALTRTGEIFGSPLYMSPEQCSGEKVDGRSDIYSLGCVLFEALTGTPPFVGDNALATMIQHQSTTSGTLREASLGVQFPETIEAIVKKMLAKNPADRYQDIGLVAHDLKAAEKGRSGIQCVSAMGSSKAKQSTIGNYTVVALLAVTAIISGLAGYFAGTAKMSGSAPDPSGAAMQRALSRPSQVDDLLIHPERMGTDVAVIKRATAKPTPSRRFAWNSWEVVTKETLEVMAQQSWIQHLNLDGDTFNDTRDFSVLCKMPNLQAVCASHSNFDDRAVAALVGCREVTGIESSYSKLDDACIPSLREMKKLNHLKLCGDSFSENGVKELSTIKSLRILHLSGVGSVNDKSIAPYANSNVYNLFVEDTALTDAAMMPLSRMKKLNEIHLDRTSVTARGLEQLCKNPNLHLVFIGGCPNISPAERDALRAKFKDILIADNTKASK